MIRYNKLQTKIKRLAQLSINFQTYDVQNVHVAAVYLWILIQYIALQYVFRESITHNEIRSRMSRVKIQSIASTFQTSVIVLHNFRDI